MAQDRPSITSSQLMTRDQAKALADRVLALSTADQTRVTIVSSWSGNTRFADASITTSGGVTDTQLSVTVAIGKRQASSSTNVLDEASLKRTVGILADGTSPPPQPLEPRLRAGAAIRCRDEWPAESTRTCSIWSPTTCGAG